MIIFIYGSDNYRATKKLHDIIEEFQKKHGAVLGVETFDLKNSNPLDDLKIFLESSPMFANKKLAIVKNVFTSPNIKNFEHIIKKQDLLNSKEDFLVIFEGDLAELKGDKKKLFTFLDKKPVLVQIFSAFKSFNQAKKWLGLEAKNLELNIDDSALEFLFNSFSQDSWRLIKEMEKLALYKYGSRVIKADVLALCNIDINPNVFKIFDSFFEQNKRKALLYFLEAIKSGIDAGLIFNMLVGQLRVALYITSGQQKELDAHPFVVRKIHSQLWRFKKEKIVKLYGELARVDLAVKRGKLDYELAMERILSNI